MAIFESMAVAVQDLEKAYVNFFNVLEDDLLEMNRVNRCHQKLNTAGHYNPHVRKSIKGYQKEHNRRKNRWARR